MLDRYVHGHVLQHGDKLGGVLSVLVDEVGIAVDQLRQPVEHVELHAGDQPVRVHQHIDESG